MDKPVRVLIAEDHVVVRDGLVALLESQADLSVVGVAGDGAEAVAETARLAPDVVVMDVSMPTMDGIRATAEITNKQPGTRVIILSMHAAEAFVRPAVRAGARGYLLKGAGTADLLAAVRAVSAGSSFFGEGVAELLLDDRPQQLSDREREVLRQVALGFSSPQIAQALGLSARTVEGHRARLMGKLQIHDLPGLVRYAIRRGLVELYD